MVINYAGVVLLLLFATRVSVVVEAEQYSVTLWACSWSTGWCWAACTRWLHGYTLVYGILFMINLPMASAVLGPMAVVCPDVRDRFGRRCV